MKKLQQIQNKLKAPKDKYNSFSKFSYRSAEGILEAVKPLLNEVGCTLTLCDEVQLIGERYYIKATATLTDLDTGEQISTSALAREEDAKKGMDGSQITGTASSYARKYALNGLFCIDDAKDADTDEYAITTQGKVAVKDYEQRIASAKNLRELKVIYLELGHATLSEDKKEELRSKIVEKKEEMSNE